METKLFYNISASHRYVTTSSLLLSVVQLSRLSSTGQNDYIMATFIEVQVSQLSLEDRHILSLPGVLQQQHNDNINDNVDRQHSWHTNV